MMRDGACEQEDDMRYEEFRDQLQDALLQVGLLDRRPWDPVESIDLTGTGRHWTTYFHSLSSSLEPFNVSAKIAFDWDAVNAARSQTTEEDLLTALLGRSKAPSGTSRRFARVDLDLYAGLVYGATAAMPDPKLFGSWTVAVVRQLGDLLAEVRQRRGGNLEVLGHVGEIELDTRCNAAGVLSLKALSVDAFRIVRVPRVWDDPDRRNREKGAARDLALLARQFRQAVDAWTASVAELARWIRHTPARKSGGTRYPKERHRPETIQ
jgi:hypothetical protein